MRPVAGRRNCAVNFRLDTYKTAKRQIRCCGREEPPGFGPIASGNQRRSVAAIGLPTWHSS